jgi:hypothetical protein
MVDFESMLALHVSGKITLVTVSAETLLNSPEKVLAFFNIQPTDEEVLPPRRMERSDDVTRVEAVSSVLTKFEDTLKVRYDIIKNLIVKEKIVLL